IISQVGGVVTINGVTQTGPMPVAGSTDWETYKTLGKTGDVKVVSDKSVAVGFFGVNSAAGYGGYFSGFSSTFQAKFTMPDSVCLGEPFDIQFTGDSIANLNVNWDFGSTDVTSTIQNNYFPTSVDYLNVGSYTIELAMDYDGCERSYSKSIVVNPLPTATISGTTEVCVDDTNPDITFTGANGTAPYTFTYNINGGANTTVTSAGVTDVATISVSTATDGTFTYNLVSVADASTTVCSQLQTGSAIVTVDPSPTATISGTTTVCEGATSPDITFTGADGTAPYIFTYNINGGSNTTVVSTGNTATVSASAATDGTFVYNLVSVADASANACSQTQTGTATVTVNPSPTATISGTANVCEGDTSPDITFTGADGTAPYIFTYNINGGANTTVTSAGLTDVATVSASTSSDGTFTYNLISVSDASANACSQNQTGTATVTVSPLATATISGTTSVCEGATNPDITFTGANGTAPYTFTYNINGGSNTTVTSVGVTDIATVSVSTSTDGTFTYNLVSVYDASANNSSQVQNSNSTVTIDPLPIATISGTTTICKGVTNPDITFTGANGTAPYTFTYNINGGANTTVVSSGNIATVSASTSTAGTFTYNLVSVSDASTNACSQTQTGNATVTIDPLPTATISGTTTICEGATSPNITFTGANGTAPYTFTYNINGGVNTTVTSAGVTNVATVSASTATDGTFIYNLVSVADASTNTCSQTQTGTATVTVNPSPTATISGTTEVCVDDTNPDITFTGANGTAPYTFTYNINGGSNTTVISTGNTATVSASTATDGAFVYNLVSVADASANACSQTQTGTATVTVNPSPTATISGTANVCQGATNPDITFTGANGTAPYTFTYNINGGANTTVVSTGNTATLSVSTATDGAYSYNLVSISDASANVCSQTQTGTATVTINPAPTATISGTTTICKGAINPDVTFTGANGTAPYTFTYNINGGAITTVTSVGVTDVVTVSASTAVDGTFTYNLVSISDASGNNCTQLQTGSAIVTVDRLPTATISGTTEICEGDTNPDVTFTGADGTAPYTFTYNINGGVNTTVVSTGNTATVSVSTTTAGGFTYNLVSVQDASNTNCDQAQSGSATITINPLPTATISGTTEICLGETNTPEITFTGADGTAPYTFTYNINGGTNTTVISTGNTATISASTSIAGDFTYNLVSVQDASNTACLQVQTAAATITVNPLPIINLTSDIAAACPGSCINFDASSSTISSGSIEQIQSNIQGDNNLYSSNTFQHCFQNAGNYNLVIEATSDKNCRIVNTFQNYIKIYTSPIANFATNNFCLNGTISLAAETNYTQNANASYEWEYNNTTTAGSTLTSTPAQSGDQSVKLIVTSSDGCLDSMTQNITIHPLPVIELTANDSTICPGSCINFESSTSIESGSVNQIESYIDGDNNLYSSNIFEHCFQDSGRYTIVTEAISDQGCSSITTFSNFIEVYPSPEAIFSVDKETKNILEAKFKFTNESVDVDSIYWIYDSIVSVNAEY
ncbi:hypothetical protein N9E20_03010, partial [Crocinitomicaceae bacterium]|nr:hypothetical protein [Crocinitomicaceae bacterium]